MRRIRKSWLSFGFVALILFLGQASVLAAIPGDDFKQLATDTNKFSLDLEENLARDNKTSFWELFGIRNDLLTMARTVERDRYYQLKAVFDKAGVKLPAFTGTYLDFKRSDFYNDPKSRGYLGDIDLASLLSKQDFNKVLNAATDMGYTVEDRVNGKYRKGGSATIKELDTTIFTPKNAKRRFKAGYFDDPEMVVGAFFTPEGKMIHKDPSLYILDNVKKSHGAALKNPGKMTIDDLQGLVKATIRIESEDPTKKARYPDIETAMQKARKGAPLNLEDSMVLMKAGHTARSSGLVNPNMVGEEYNQAIKRAQGNCMGKIKSVYRQNNLYDDIENQGHTDKYKEALKKGNYITAQAHRDRLYQYNRNRYLALRGAIRNGNLTTIAQLEGMELDQEMRRSGLRYRDKKTGRLYTASQLENQLLAKNKRGMRQAQTFDQEIQRQASKAQRLQECKTVLGHVDAAVGAFHGFKKAEEKFLANMTGDESILEFYGTTVAQGTYYALGLDNYTKVASSAFDESRKQMEAEIAAGEDPSVAWAVTRGALRAVNDVGLHVIKNVIIGKTVGAVVKPYQLISEGTGLIKDRNAMHAARQDYEEFKQRVGAYRLEIARRNGRVSQEFDTFLQRVAEIQAKNTVTIGRTEVRCDLDDVLTKNDLWYGQLLKKRAEEHRNEYLELLRKNSGKMTPEVSQKLGEFRNALRSLDWYTEDSMHKLAVAKSRAKVEARARKTAKNRAKENPEFSQFYEQLDKWDLKKLLASGLVNRDDIIAIFGEKEYYLSQGWRKVEDKGKEYYVDAKNLRQGRHVFTVRNEEGKVVYQETSYYVDDRLDGEVNTYVADEERPLFHKKVAYFEMGIPVGLHKEWVIPGIILWQSHYTPEGKQIRYQNLSGNYKGDYFYNITEWDEDGKKLRSYESKSPVD